MKEKSMVKEMEDLFNKLSDLREELETLACRAHMLEENADELTAVVEDMCQELKWVAEKEEKK